MIDINRAINKEKINIQEENENLKQISDDIDIAMNQQIENNKLLNIVIDKLETLREIKRQI